MFTPFVKIKDKAIFLMSQASVFISYKDQLTKLTRI